MVVLVMRARTREQLLRHPDALMSNLRLLALLLTLIKRQWQANGRVLCLVEKRALLMKPKGKWHGYLRTLRIS